MSIPNIKEAKEYINKADIISFDVFDTLILRLVNKPEDIFRIIEEQLELADFSTIRVEFQQKASIKIEREKKYPHADIDEIYKYISEEDKLNADCEKVKEYELKLELDNVICNKEIYELYQYAISQNKRIIATSDMYIKKENIKEMLTKCGYSDINEIYVSSDMRKTKYNGDLYDAVMYCEKIKPGQICHIGDNYLSDFTNASNKGIQAFHYKNENHPILDDNTNVFSSIDAGIVRAIKTNFSNESFWFKLGAQVGGSLYTGLIEWFMKFIKSENHEKIFFLSRDGYILYNLLKEKGMKNIEYLYTSRRALLLAGIEKLDEESLNNLPPFTYGQTIDDILLYIDCCEISDESIKKVGFHSRYDRITSHNDFNKMKALYIDNEALILNKCAKERENAEKYFSSCGLMESNSIIFDCGWNGSSQYLLDRLLNLTNYNGKNKFYYAGIMNSEKAHRQLNNRQFETYLFGFNHNSEIENELFIAIVITEMFFCAPHDSVWKYGSDGPILEEYETSHEYKKDIYRGIKEYIRISTDFFEKYNFNIAPKDAIRSMINLINKPTMEEAYNIGNLGNVDGFVLQSGQKKYIAKISLSTLVRNPNSEIYWPKGIIARNDINPIVKYFVSKKYNISRKSTKEKKHKPIKKNNIYKQAIKILVKEGPMTFGYQLKKYFSGKYKDSFNEWIKKNEIDLYKVNQLKYNPLISVIVPVYNVLDDQLIDCIYSVKKQTYKNWELCLVDDASTWDTVRNVLARYEKDENIRIIYRKENGHISRATNDGINIAKGEFIAFLDCDDILAPNALYEMAVKLNENNKYDFIYSDEDKLTADGKKRHSPFFKPDWSPDTFMSLMYTCHFSMYRKSIVDDIGGLTIGLEGAQDYDFTLRFTEKAKYIGHIPKLLYHWREREESIASNPESKPYALEAVKKSKEAALLRRGLEGTVEYVKDMYQYRVVYKNKLVPLTSIIIPSKDNYNALCKCITSIKEYTDYPNFEIIVVDNGSNSINKKSYEQLCKIHNSTYYYSPMDFNFSKMCNMGAKLAKGSLLLFLNDDIEIFTKNWLDILVGHASLDHVGAVGAKLLYPESNIIQHIGITNLNIGPSHSQIGFDDRFIYYYGRNRMDYNYIAVTAACLMIEKRKFEEIEGFDEKLTVGYNDVDVCFKLIEHGYYNLTRNDVVLYHHESLSRGSDTENKEKSIRLLKERDRLYQKHPQFKGKDPFYNENLTNCKVNYDLNIQVIEIANICRRFNKTIKRQWTNSNLNVCIDSVLIDNDDLCIEGWAFIQNKYLNNLNEISILLIDEDDNKYIIETQKVYRPDVTNALGRKRNLNFSGFRCNTRVNLEDNKKYQIGILLKHKILHRTYFVLSDKFIEYNL